MRAGRALLLLALCLTASGVRGNVDTMYKMSSFCNMPGMTLNGHATKGAYQSGVVLQLLEAVKDRTGSAFFNQAFTNVLNVTVSFKFVLSAPDGDGADGFAFVMQTQSPYSIGREASGLGYDGILNGLAVEFDFHQNKDLGDPAKPHVSVHGKGTSAAATMSADEASSSHNAFAGTSGGPFKEWPEMTQQVGTVKQATIIITQNNVMVTAGEDGKSASFTMNKAWPNAAKGLLPMGADSSFWFGFTGATGGDYIGVAITDLELTVAQMSNGASSMPCAAGFVKQSGMCIPDTSLAAQTCHLIDGSCESCVSSQLCCGYDNSKNVCKQYSSSLAGTLLRNGQCPSQLSRARAGAYASSALAFGILAVALAFSLVLTCWCWHSRYSRLQATTSTISTDSDL